MEKTKLPEPFRTDWINDLRSGEYKQGTGMLLFDGKFCCLGVGASIKGAEKKDLIRKGITPRRMEFDTGLTFEEKIDLVLMNDNGKTFSEIAGYIEQNH